MNNIKPFYLSDLNSKISFLDWISKNVPGKNNISINSDAALVYLDYIYKSVESQKIKDKAEWFKQIKKLMEIVKDENK